MRILHTSDWHLGKTLEGFSRIEEQEKFIDELIGIVRDKKIDLVLIAGDIYDTSNPPAKAESLFYRAIKGITEDKKRGIIIVSGNHDNPERLVAPSPLASNEGIILLGTPRSVINKGKYGCMDVVDSGEGFIEIELKGERAVIITLPYPSERRLNEVFSDEFDQRENQRSYSERVGELFCKLQEKYRDDTINLAISHIYIKGGKTCDSERPIELGGSFAVGADKLPQKAQYIALGHLHKPQRIEYNGLNIMYSGSPLQYSKSEIDYAKSVYIIDVKAGQKPKIERVYLKNYKPIEVWKFNSIEDAIERCRNDGKRNIWVYIKIKTDRVITPSEMKEMRDLRPDILEIQPDVDGTDEEAAISKDMSEKSMKELFEEFYRSRRQMEPSEELIDLFLKVIQKEGDEDETFKTQAKGA
ncbi:MAG: exonuclease SbcCD subunit D [Clostridiales bacterium]|nr:exonuclease SbcCD subunit D [Clostridiales bacterium]